MKNLVLVVMIVILLAGSVAWSDVYVPQAQWITWNEPTFDPAGAATGVLLAFKVEVHEQTVPNTWATVATIPPGAPTGLPWKRTYDVPKDGKFYQFRVTTTVTWPDATQEVLTPCLSEWAKVRVATPGGCAWANR